MLLTLLCAICLIGKSQSCLLVYDNMEVYTWPAGWNVAANTGYFSDASVSPSFSGVLYGNGTGSSVVESANYVLTNVTGLNIAYAHKLSFRLASYRFSNPAATTVGVDGPDFIDVRYTTNNGTTFTTEMRIAGNANAYWNYNTANASKIANGFMTTYAPTAGGNRTSTGDGYSIIELTIPAGKTQLGFSLNCRVNANGEEWWLDNIELIQLGPCAVLPIELLNFDGYNENDYNVLNWLTATETNNKCFILYKSVDGMSWIKLAAIQGAGTVNTPTNYSYKDYSYDKSINYYKLTQTDYSGLVAELNTIYIDNTNSTSSQPFRIVNILGQDVDYNAPGLKIYYYLNGVSRLVIH